MWYTTGLLCGLLLVVLAGSPRADVQCDGIDDLLTQALNLDTFINATTFTITAWANSPGTTFASNTCWSNGPFLMDTTEVLAVGRSGTTGTGNACVMAYDGSERILVDPLSLGWYSIAVRLSGGTLTLFTYGFARQSVAMGAITDLTLALNLCGGPDGKSPDRLSQIAIYDTALSDGQIESIARARLWHSVRGSPTAYWPLNDCADGTSGNTVSFKDRSVNNRHVTGNHGGNGTGLTCRANGFHSHAGWIQ